MPFHLVSLNQPNEAGSDNRNTCCTHHTEGSTRSRSPDVGVLNVKKACSIHHIQWNAGMPLLRKQLCYKTGIVDASSSDWNWVQLHQAALTSGDACKANPRIYFHVGYPVVIMHIVATIHIYEVDIMDIAPPPGLQP